MARARRLGIDWFCLVSRYFSYWLGLIHEGEASQVQVEILAGGEHTFRCTTTCGVRHPPNKVPGRTGYLLLLLGCSLHTWSMPDNGGNLYYKSRALIHWTTYKLC